MPEKKPSISDIVAEYLGSIESDHLAQEEEEDLERARAELENQDLAQDIDLKKMVAKSAIAISGGSIAAIFILVLISGTCERVDISDNVQIALITGVALESIGIVGIVAKYLFPS